MFVNLCEFGCDNAHEQIYQDMRVGWDGADTSAVIGINLSQEKR